MFEKLQGFWLIDPVAMAQWQFQMSAVKPSRSVDLQPAKGGKSIAVIKIEGPLMPQASWFGTSTVQLINDINAAASDSSISGILLAINSPGGTVAGTYELGAAVKAATATKPTHALVSGMAASAAYWAASQADLIFASNPMSLTGSIGTYQTLYDYSGMLEKDGVKAVHLATGGLKGAGAFGTPITDEQRAHFQEIIDGMQLNFDAAVRSGRGMSAAELANVRTGGVFLAKASDPAKDAQKLKLIDGIKSFDATVKALASAK